MAFFSSHSESLWGYAGLLHGSPRWLDFLHIGGFLQSKHPTRTEYEGTQSLTWKPVWLHPVIVDGSKSPSQFQGGVWTPPLGAAVSKNL